MKKTLRPYQQELLDEILRSKANKLCVQLSTGAGKTVIFTELIYQLNKKTLILVDSIDLVNQTVDTFKKQGIDTGCVLAGNKVFPQNKVIVAMVQSLWNRREKLPSFDLCVIDECHIAVFDKLIPFLKEAQIIGFTATPVRLGRYKINENQTAKKTLSDVYDEIICGKPIEWLMANNYLINEQDIYFDFDDSTLKTDSSGEYTSKSMDVTFQSENYQKSLLKTFDKYCDGKKTMIFTSSCATNLIYQNLFDGKNVKTYDSKNNIPSERDEIIEWFKNTPDAILINTGCFTKGFDVCDVEVIIMARATKSLSLWIQIAGRGARTTKKIDKDFFLLVDGGNNNKEHQSFSFNRDWKKIFYDKDIKDIVSPIQECEFCGFTFLESEKICHDCGEAVPEKPIGEEREQKTFELFTQASVIPIPTLNLDFHINKDDTKFEALKVLKNKWILFLNSKEIKESDFIYHENKQFKEKFRIHLRPIYFKILSSMLKDGKHVKYESFIQKILTETKSKKYGTN